MKKRFISFIAILFLFLPACIVHKGPPSPTAKPEARTFDVCIRQGTLFLNRGESEKAVGKFREAIALNPNSSRAYNFLGMAYFQQKNYDLAEKQFEKAVALDPSFASAYCNLGGVYSMKHQFEKAKEMFKKALALSPDLVSANYSLGSILFYLGEAEEGTIYLSKGIALDPDFLDKQGAFIVGLSSLTFSSPDIFFTYAKLYASTGNIEKTVDYLSKAKKAGFHDWERILDEKEFEKVRDDLRIQEFLK